MTSCNIRPLDGVNIEHLSFSKLLLMQFRCCYHYLTEMVIPHLYLWPSQYLSSLHSHAYGIMLTLTLTSPKFGPTYVCRVILGDHLAKFAS